MKRGSLVLAVVLLVTFSGFASFIPQARSIVPPTAQVIYNSIPASLPPNFPSQGFECCQINEIGDYVIFAGTQRLLSNVTVVLSDWAKHSQYPFLGSSQGWGPFPITLALFNVDHSHTPVGAGSLIESTTQSFPIPWRPETTPYCSGNDGYNVTDSGACYHGLAFKVTFDFTSLNVVLPNEVVWGITYNTQSRGYQPIGINGPYNSLNVALMNETAYPTLIGTDATGADGMFRNATMLDIGNQDVGYNSAGAVNVFRLDIGWATSGDSNLAIQFVAVPAVSTVTQTITSTQSSTLITTITTTYTTTTTYSTTTHIYSYPVSIDSNSTVANWVLNLNGGLNITVYGPPGTIGHLRIAFLRQLINGSPVVIEDNYNSVPLSVVVGFNSTHFIIDIWYTHSLHSFQIQGSNSIPEIPTALIPVVLILVLATVAALTRRKGNPR